MHRLPSHLPHLPWLTHDVLAAPSCACVLLKPSSPHHPRPLAAGPLAKIYFGSQFAPLIIFFVMFLSIVKNTKLHHFVRFNCMQARGVTGGVGVVGAATHQQC